MKLEDFATLNDAQIYEEKTYTLITPGVASQFLGLQGILSKVRAKTSDTTLVQVIPGVDTTLGEVCNIVLGACESTGFATDPAEEDGMLNRAAADVMRNHNILTQAQVDAFFNLGTTVNLPFAKETKHSFDVAKGNVTRRIAKKTVLEDSVVIEISTAAPEKHNPRITTDTGKRINSVYGVKEPGLYVATIPNEYRGMTLYVDDAYGVIV